MALQRVAVGLQVEVTPGQTVYRYRTVADLLEVSSHYQRALADAGFEITRSEAVGAPTGSVRSAVLRPSAVHRIAVTGERGPERVEVEADGPPGDVEVRLRWWR